MKMNPKIPDIIYTLIMGVGVYITVVGLINIMGFGNLDLSRMSSRDGLIAILIGFCGIELYTDRELRKRIRKLEGKE